MPIYEYQCRVCKHPFETLVASANTPKPPCPSCGSKQVDKQFSSFRAAVATKADSCSMGTCPSGTCAGGGCPFERG